MSKNTTIQKEYNQIISNLKKIMLENPKWVKDWTIGIKNYFSNTSYSILNQLNLSMLMASKGIHKEPYFATFKQILEAGAKLKKGSKGYPIWFYKPIEVESEEKKEIINEYGEKEEIIKKQKKMIFFLKKYIVFNIEDTDIKLADDNIFNNANFYQKIREEVNISYGNPAWIVGEKKILMPKIKDFKNKDSFIAALFHEFSHYTHWKLSLMDLSKDNYAFDEVVAETSAAVLCNYFKINYPVERHAGYLKSWGEKLNDKEFEKALKEAGKVVTEIVNFIEKE